MSESSSTNYQQLKALVEARPELLKRLADTKDLHAVAESMSQIAADEGIEISSQEIVIGMQTANQHEGRPNGELNEQDLELVSGGSGSPYCMWTKGCYCFFTK
jgi:hypothetical protein